MESPSSRIRLSAGCQQQAGNLLMLLGAEGFRERLFSGKAKVWSL